MALSAADQAQLDALYIELKPQATETARNYVLSRTPAAWQEDMAAKIEADWPAPPDPPLAGRDVPQQPAPPAGSTFFPSPAR